MVSDIKKMKGETLSEERLLEETKKLARYVQLVA